MDKLNEFTLGDLFQITANGIEFVDKAIHGRDNHSYSYSSATRAASDLIMIHPVLCSSNVSLKSSTLLTKHVERKACVDMQIVLSAINITNAQNGFDYIRKFHQNIEGIGTAQDFEDMIINMNKNLGEANIPATTVNRILIEMNRVFHDRLYDIDLNPICINDYIVKENADTYTIELLEYKGKSGHNSSRGRSNNSGGYNNRRNGNGGGSSSSGNGTTGYDPISSIRNNSVQLRDSDAKKVNSAVPSMLVVRFKSTNNGTITAITSEIVIGIKAKLIPVDSMEILRKIYDQNRDGRGLVNLIRATTGEINIITDYLLAIDRQRSDILSRHIKGSKQDIWKKLENRANMARIALDAKKENRASAITTVIITDEDADYLYKNENIDVRRPTEAKKFMQAYNLQRFIIANDVDEYCMVLEDTLDPDFEKIAYSMLERETKDTEFKKIIDLMSKMR